MSILRVLLSAAGPAPDARHRVRLMVVLTVLTAGASVIAAEALARAVLGAGVPALVVLAVAVAVRGLIGAARDAVAGSAAAAVAAGVRIRLLDAPPPRPGDPAVAAGADAALLGAGVDGLHDAVAVALPRLLTGTVLPLLVLARVAAADPRSAVVVLAGLVGVPVFMALVGRHTGEQTRERLGELARLGGVFADVLRALPGLRVLGRAGDQPAVVRHWSHAYRRSTLRVLRTAFLSALVLELLASVSIAVVAVPIGLRLLDGTMPLVAGLVVLLLVPEAFAALRAAGASAHETAAGLAVLDRLPRPGPAPDPGRDRSPGPDRGLPRPGSEQGRRSSAVRRARTRPGPAPAVPGPAGAEVELAGIRASWEPGRPVLDGLDLRLEPGTCTALLGPSGCGKSTVLAVLTGLLVPEAGEVRVDGAVVPGLTDPRWRARLAWAPQSPQLTGRTVAEALRLADPAATDDRLWAALAAADVDDVVAAAPDGLSTPLQDGQVRFSAGERHRLGLARALLRTTGPDPAGLLLCDEPTAHVDAAAEARVLDRRPSGVTMLVATHRATVARRADRVVRLIPAAGNGSPDRPGTRRPGGAPRSGPQPGRAALGPVTP